MKKLFLSAFALALFISNAVVAQDWEEKRKSKTRENNSNNEEIIIKRKAGKDARVVIEIRDDEVLVNGKPLEDYDNDDVVVLRRKGNGTSTYSLVTPKSPFRAQGGTFEKNDNWNKNDNLEFFSTEGAFLGVTTEDDDDGAKITAVTKGSAAEKAGLEKGDIIKKVNDIEIENPADLSKAIRKMRPEDKVKITFERDGDEETVTAKLGKRDKMGIGKLDHFENLEGHIQPHFELEMPKMDFNFDDSFGQTFIFPGKGRLGIRAQDTDEGDGVKVLDVDPGSAADKAGLRRNDIILQFDGEDVDSAEELAEIAQDRKDKSSVRIRINRNGRTETLELNVQKKLKTSNL